MHTEVEAAEFVRFMRRERKLSLLMIVAVIGRVPAKGMEPDMAVEMTHKLNDSGCQIKVLHADNDSTTTSRLKVHFEDLEKKDDQNHVKKGFSKKLYELSKKYKELKHPDVIPYLVRCFMYKSLPGGKCLSNDALTSELRELVQQYNRRAESLQNMGSTQANENFNQIVGSKCPKARKKAQRSSSVKEGTTYQQEVEVNENACDIIQQIPSSLILSNTDKYVVFDLETTSLSRNSDITQLAAASGLNLFQRYIMPRCDISNEASKITGIAFCHATNKMYLNGREVETCTIQQGLLDFLDFLKLNELPILVGHNITNFDMMVLENRLKEFNMFSAFTASVKGFIDTLKLSKRVFQKQMLTTANNKPCELFSQKLQSSCEDDLHHVNFNSCKLSLKPLVDKKIINATVCIKLARSGINVTHLKLANSRDVNGIKLILTDNNVNNRYASSIIGHLSGCEE
ncbi:unnamed protein product [Mytilus edulis]|uniref:Exonuclease domain-containing protein n=1 Tax=Mytilus edulis TaxID=6550 RepID=A0A8S3QNC0_MYTED|nr:unnamed protein product [Mytilus edulis]